MKVSIQVKNALKEDGQAAFANWRDPKQAKAMADAGETSKVRTDKAGNKIAGQTHMADEAYVKELEEVFGKGNVKIVKVPKANGKGTENIIIATGTTPFKASRVRVTKAKNLFPVLRTLVVPIFPDPIFLISIFEKNFVNIKPKGIDPQK